MITIIIYDIPQIIYDKYYQFIVLLYLYACKYTVSTATKSIELYILNTYTHL